MKISKKVERIRAHLEKWKIRKGKKYEPECNVESSMNSSSVASNDNPIPPQLKQVN